MAKQPDALARPKRFYKVAAAAPVEGGFAVQLDGRTPKTPGGARLVLPTIGLAELVAGEWEAQGEHIDVQAMPLTRLANTAIDRVSQVRTETADEVARYAGSDLLCYFTDYPRVLVAEQAARWGPVLEWAANDLGIELNRAVGIVHQPQDPAALARVQQLALELDDFGLAGLAHLGALLGSSILALAVLKGRLSAEEAYDLSRLDEAFQVRQWGQDEEAAVRTANHAAEAAGLGRWLQALDR
jgi:chaperone required for assembly of F1-ATPase